MVDTAKLAELINNINNYTWYPTKSYAEEFSIEYREHPDVLNAIKNRIDKNLLHRPIIYNKDKCTLPTSRYSCRIVDNRLCIMYCYDQWCAYDLQESYVNPDVLLYGSIWYDLEHNEKNNIKSNYSVYSSNCSKCKSKGLTYCQCCGDETIEDER